MSLSSSLHELETLILSLHPLVVIETPEEQRARGLVAAAASELDLPFFEWSMTLGLQYGQAAAAGGNPIATTLSPEGVLRHLRALDREGLYLLKDFGVHLQEPGVTRLLREVCQTFASTAASVLITGPAVDLPAELEPHATYLKLRLPDAEELREAIDALLRSLRQRLSRRLPERRSGLDRRSGARRGASPRWEGERGGQIDVALDEPQLEQLVQALRGMTLNQARQAVAYAVLEDGKLSAEDVGRITDRKARLIQDSGLLEYFPAEDNDFELGGFDRLQAWLERAHQGFSLEAARLNLAPPRGLLLAGVQGCGKSLAAKVIARRWRQPLLKLDAGRLYDKYVGESERNLRRALELAEAMEPVVLWIDEIEKAFGASAADSHDGGLSRRLQGHLLTWLQERRARVFVVATANDVFALPPELVRKGRFNEVFFVDLPTSRERREIFEIHLRRRRQQPEAFQLDDLVLASDGMTGAEIEQTVISGLYRALHEQRPLDDALLLREIDAAIPLSVSRREEVERLRSLARERFVPVSSR